MSKKEKLLLLLTVFAITWMPWLINAWDKDKPAATTGLNLSNPQILANQSALETAIGQDHEFSTGGSNTGKHTQITFDDPLGTDPASVTASEGVLYLKDTAGKASLFFIDEDENVIQLTSGTGIYGTSLLADTVDSAAYAAGSIDAEHLAADVIDETKLADNSIDSEHYNDGSIDAVHLAADVIDESKIADNGIDSEHYNDGSIDSAHIGTILGARTTEDDDSNAMIVSHAYLANQDGFVGIDFTCGVQGVANYCRVYSDSDNDPVTGGTVVGRWEDTDYHNTSTKGFVGWIPISSGEYFEVRSSGLTVSAIYWAPIGTLVKCTDQD